MEHAPDFFVIGAAKCGTTSVCDLLRQHPHVFMARPREPHYFSDRTGYHHRGEWYQRLFDGADAMQVSGEGSTSYTRPDVIRLVARRLFRAAPDSRLIYMVRHPLDRLESDWKMKHQEGRKPGPISDAVEDEPHLIQHGLYWTNLNVYRKHFSDDQILVCFLEEFAEDPEAELSRMFRHLGVDPGVPIQGASRPRNRGSERRYKRLLLKATEKAPGFRLLLDKVPPRLKKRLRRVLTTHRPPPVVEWDPKVREEVLAELRDDADPFLEFFGKPKDFWSLDPTP